MLTFDEFKKKYLDAMPDETSDPAIPDISVFEQIASIVDLDGVEDEELQGLITAAGGVDAFLAIRDLSDWADDFLSEDADEVEEPGNSDRRTIRTPRPGSEDAVEFIEIVIRIARIALSRGMFRDRSGSNRSTATVAQELFSTHSDLFDRNSISDVSFYCHLADQIVLLMVVELEQQIKDAQSNNLAVRQSLMFLEALKKSETRLAKFTAEKRRAFCLQQFLELDQNHVCQVLNITNDQFMADVDEVEQAIASDLSG